jgi:hypothetical protein
MNRIMRAFAVLCFIGSLSSIASAEVITFQNCWSDPGFNLIHQDVHEVEIVFSVPSIQVMDLDINGETMQGVAIPGVILPNDAGAPNLPAMSRYIAIPQGARAELVIVDYRTETYHDMDIAPAFEIPLNTDNSPLKYWKNSDIYQRNAFYPAQPVLLSQPTKIRGVDVVTLGITPFQYNPITRDLIVYKDLRIRVNFLGGNGHFGEDRLRSRWWEPVLRQNLLNYQSLPDVDFNRVRQTDEDNVEYVIIVPDDPEFLAWADTLKQWRNQQGIITGITPLSEIGGNVASLIDDYIVDACSSWAIPPVAVLLLSDYQSSGDLYGITAPSFSYSSYDCVSDNYYADIDGNDLPDLYIGRIAAQNGNQLQKIISKMLDYERQPYTTSHFYDHPIVAGGWQSDRWFILCTEVIYGYFANVLGKEPVREYSGASGPPSYWSTNQNTYMIVNYFGPNGLGYIPELPSHLNDWGGNATRINNDINSGAFLLQHRDHGAVSGWSSPSYHIDDLVGLHNSMRPFVFSINCLTGKFDDSDMCFAEAFHRMQNGALGVIAASNVSYSFVNDTYVWGVFDSMFPDFDPGYGLTLTGATDLRPGFGNVNGKYYLALSSWPYNPQHKQPTFYLMHHHGDVFMTLYSEQPQHLNVTHYGTMLAGATLFTVCADSGALICLSQEGDILGAAESTGEPTTFSVEPMSAGDTFKVTVTKANYYRYVSEVEVIEQVFTVPAQVENLAIALSPPDVELTWSPVTTDTAGNPIAISYYSIYMSPDDPLFVPTSGDSIGYSSPMDTTYVDDGVLNDPMRFYNVRAVIED